LCIENDEKEKYLMTFQNFLSRVPKWNNDILEKEVNRIKEISNCEYLEDLISCVHIIQLKALTCIRVGQKQKTINIDIPILPNFVHKVYIHLARKLFSNVYLFENNIPPLGIQKNNREIELITKDCILEAIRESIPVNSILRAYLDESVEEVVNETITETEVMEPVSNNDQHNTVASAEIVPVSEIKTAYETETGKVSETETETNNNNDNSNVKIDIITPVSLTPPPPPPPTPPTPPPQSLSNNNELHQTIKFSDIDETQDVNRVISNEVAPKDIDTLEQISRDSHNKKNLLDMMDEDDGLEKIKIHNNDNDNIVLDIETL